MKQDELNKRYARAAAIDAQNYNRSNEDLYSPEQRAFAEQLFIEIDLAYQGATIYRNYRKKYITITANNPGQNRFRAAVRELDKKLDERGVIIKKTARNNFVYQLPENF